MTRHIPRPGPWHVIGPCANGSGAGTYWLACRDIAGGLDYLLTRTGRRRRFLTIENACAAIIRATRRQRK